MAIKERLHWRDERISERHRLYGELYASDIDFMLIEQTYGTALALVEWKHINAIQPPDFSKSTYQALLDLANNRINPIPCWTAYYNPDIWTYVVYPANVQAQEMFPINGEVYSEIDYVRKLYQLRNKILPHNILVQLRGDK